jgi:hypothetical protein
MVWLVLSLRVEETPYWYGTSVQIYWISSRRQPRRGGIQIQVRRRLWITTEIHNFIQRNKRHWISMHCSAQGMTRTGLIWHTFESNDGPLSRNTLHKGGWLSRTAKLLKTADPRNKVDELGSLFHILGITGLSSGRYRGPSCFFSAPTQIFSNITSN